MVSNVLRMTEDDVIASLERIGRTYADDPEYQAVRAELPADWPF